MVPFNTCSTVGWSSSSSPSTNELHGRIQTQVLWYRKRPLYQLYLKEYNLQQIDEIILASSSDMIQTLDLFIVIILPRSRPQHFNIIVLVHRASIL